MSQGKLLYLVSSPFTCLCRNQAKGQHLTLINRSLSFSSSRCSEDNKDYEINPEFINRNDRCLEYKNLLPRRKGWQYQRPTKEFYYRLTINPTAAKIEAILEHSSGRKVVSASSAEWAIRQFLYSGRDLSAAVNLGRVFAERCLKAGIVSVFYDPNTDVHGSEKVKVILKALEEAGIQIGEDEVFEKKFRPGINYDGKNRLGERKQPDDVQIIQ